MGENATRFDGDIDLPGGSFSRLLFSPDDTENSLYHSHSHSHSFLMFSSPSSPPPLFSANTPKMLCFGDYGGSDCTQHQLQQSTSTPFSNKKRNGTGKEPGKRTECNGGSETENQTQKNGKKKNKPEVGPTRKSNSAVHAKVRREKLGERIAALQQLVCPYGKTDTASVLHEAMGYIRFLQDQVKVLSSPYLQQLPSSSPPHCFTEEEGEKETEPGKGLKSRGLCLVPMQCLVEIANTNGADFWSSALSTKSSKP